MSTPVRLDTADALRSHLRIRETVFFEVHGKRHEDSEPSDSKTVRTTQVMYAHNEGATTEAFSVRLRTDLVTPEASFVTDCAIFFSAEEPFSFSEEAVNGFMATTGVQLLDAHTREAIEQTAVRLRVKRPQLGFPPLTGAALAEGEEEEL
ncbi:hypothetical protein [Nocardiopsis sp. LOL_012]|uniref:hypothetical protein n=1 Tax=Nocardiopsis sp. LOL_012 TaxID=3345409 RepID=UPI003A848DE1